MTTAVFTNSFCPITLVFYYQRKEPGKAWLERSRSIYISGKKLMVLNWEFNCDVFALPDIELNNAANN